MIFSRHATIERIYFAYRLYEIVESVFSDVEDELIRSYKLARFFFLYALRMAIEKDDLGRRICDEPALPLSHETKLFEGLAHLAKLLVKQFNFLIQNRAKNDAYFDYKSELKNRDQVELMAREIINTYETGLVLYPEGSVTQLLTKKIGMSADEYFQQGQNTRKQRSKQMQLGL